MTAPNVHLSNASLSGVQSWLKTASSKTFFKSPKGLIVIFLLIFVIAVVVWQVIFNTEEKAVKYTTETVVRGDIESLVTATGVLQPKNFVDVGAQVSGQLKKLHVDIGSEVKAGDLVAEIDATVYTARVDATRASLENQKAQLLDREAQLTLAQQKFGRQENLLSTQATAKELVETANAGLQSAQAQLNSLRAQIKQTESTLRVEEANLRYAKIYAPIDGTVMTLTSRQGQTLNANQMAPTIMRIADLSKMTVQTQVSEADIGRLTIGMPVYFTILGNQEKRWYGSLERVQPTPEVTNSVVLFNALFDVPNDNRLLMTQMSAQVFFIEAEAKDVLMIPVSALNFSVDNKSKDRKMSKDDSKNPMDKNQKQEWKDKKKKQLAEKSEDKKKTAIVKVMNEKSNVEDRTVVVGVTNRVQAEIIEGLQENETVIIGTLQSSKLPAAGAGGGLGGGYGGMGRR